MEKRLFNAIIHCYQLDSVICGTFLNSHTIVDVTVQSKMWKSQSLLSRSLYSFTVTQKLKGFLQNTVHPIRLSQHTQAHLYKRPGVSPVTLPTAQAKHAFYRDHPVSSLLSNFMTSSLPCLFLHDHFEHILKTAGQLVRALKKK